MSRWTEWLLQAAASLVILWFGWQFISVVVLDHVIARQQLAACRQQAQGGGPSATP